MNRKTALIIIAGISIIFISIIGYWFMTRNENEFVDLPPTFPEEAKAIVDATRKYIYKYYNPKHVKITSEDWLTPAQCLENAQIVVGVNGFKVFRSKWFFLNLKDKYIGIFPNEENNLISIAKLNRKGNRWIVYDYYLLPGTPLEHTKQFQKIKNNQKPTKTTSR